jgi:nucleoside-diphosphate-sugar epimerase
MNEIKTIFILGGTGFVGRAVTEKYLKNNWRVVIPTRAKDIDKAKDELLLHGFDKNFLEESTSNSLLLFVLDVDLINKRWIQTDTWIRLFKEADVSCSSILRIANFVGETSKSTDEILRSNIDTLESIFTLVKYVKSKNREVIFLNMGSVAEKKKGQNLAPYECAKRIARQKIEESGLCDFHFIAHYIKGKGEQKMKSAAPLLWERLKFSHRWLFGFKVSVIDVDDLAEIIYHILEIMKLRPKKHKPLEINVTNGELIFGEIVRNLLPESNRDIPKQIIPNWLEKAFLYLYSVIIPIIKPEDQLARRLASFAKRSLMNSKKQSGADVFKTAEDIKKLAVDTDNYEVLERISNLIVSNKHYPVIYVLRERNEEELKQIVQKALIDSN